jgi:hypothetical protein
VKGGVIETLYGVPRYDTLRIRVTIQGHHTISLIGGGATQNFIDDALVARRELQTKEFKGFDFTIDNGHTIEFLD